MTPGSVMTAITCRSPPPWGHRFKSTVDRCCGACLPMRAHSPTTSDGIAYVGAVNGQHGAVIVKRNVARSCVLPPPVPSASDYRPSPGLASVASPSRLSSSMTLRNRSARPSWCWSSMNTIDQIMLMVALGTRSDCGATPMPLL
jgi:hypothetical protein